MPYLTAAVILIGLACAANLLLTFGVIRRLKAAAGAAPGQTGRGEPPVLPSGSRLPAFAATAVDGTVLDNARLDGDRALIGFFSSQCEPCRDGAGRFLRYAAAEGVDPDRVLAIVQGTPAQTAEFRERYLRPLAGSDEGFRTVVEPEGGPVAKSLGVVAFPQYYIVDADGVLEAAVLSAKLLPTTAGA